MKKINVLIAEDKSEYAKEIKEFFLQDDTINVVGLASNGKEAVNMINELTPDLVFLDLVLRELDGFGVMNAIKGNKPKIIVCSALASDAFVNRAISMGADYFMAKPLSFATLKERSLDLFKEIDKPKEIKIKRPENRILDEKLSNIFLTMGIPAHIKGYQFLREAIKMSIETPELINSITKKLYPAIADRFDTSSSKVERAIRHAIEVAWNRGKIENLNAIFGIKVYGANEKPTNGEFIALVADKMLIEGM